MLATQLQIVSTGKKLMDLSEEELGEIISEITLENDALRREIVDIELKLSDYERKREEKRSILNQAVKDLQTLKILGGLVSVEGRGVKVTVTDSEKILKPFDFLEIVQELKGAGAESIAVNNHRLSAFSYFSRREGGLAVDGEEINPPYVFEAIGDPDILSKSLEIPGGVVDTLSSLNGVEVIVEKMDKIILPKTERKEFTYAKFKEK
jgi:uncharacterized protein YlxW (UPF0749 family)